jgi:N-acetylneuraminic acid mutarotase
MITMIAPHPATSWAAEVDLIPPTAPLPEAIASFGAAVADDWLYVSGGHVGRTHQHSRKNLSAAFRRLNLLDGVTWESLPGGTPAQGLAMVASGGKLYRLGGMTAHNDSSDPEDLHSLADVTRYDPLSRTWTPLPSLPTPRSSHDAATLDGKIYVIGGWNLAGEPPGSWHASALVFDLDAASPQWDNLPDPPFQRRALAVAAADDRIYAIGGILPSGDVSNDVDIYTVSTKQWSKGPTLPGFGFGVAAFGVGGTVYVSGREGRVHRLDDGARWTPVTTLAFPRIFHRLVARDEQQLVVLGGAMRGGHIRQIEMLSLAPIEDRPRVATWTLPFPGCAKNRQGVFLHEQALYVFGGNNSLRQHDFDPENFLDEAFRIHLGSMTVTPIANLPVKRQSLQTIILNQSRNTGYAVGGFGHDGEVARAHAEVYSYRFRNDAWKKSTVQLPSPRTQFSLIDHDETVWLFGGLDYDPRRTGEEDFRHVTDVLAWDTTDENAGFVPSGYELPRPRRAFGCDILDDRVYLVGGMREGFQLLDTCDVFDLASRSWSMIPAPARPRISPQLVALRGKLYLAGGTSPKGEDDFEPNPTVEMFDPGTGAWSTVLDSLPIPLRHRRMFVMGDRLLVYAAHDARHNAVHVALIDP